MGGVPITAFHATKIMICFDQLGITGFVTTYKTVYRDTNSNFLCNVHTGRRGMKMELQNSDSNPNLAQILFAITQESEPSEFAW